MDQDEKNNEWHIVAISGFSVVLFCGLLDFILYENFISQGVFFLYCFGFSLLPLVLYGIDRYSGFFTKTGGITRSGWVALIFNALFCFKMASSPDTLGLSSAVFMLMMAYLLLMVLRFALFKDNNREVSISPRVSIIVSALVLWIVLLGFLNTFFEHMWFDIFDGIAVEIPHWGGWLAVLVGAFSVFSGYILWGIRSKNTEKPSIWTLLVCCSPILLFSIQSSFDVNHYDAFVGPAIAVLHGRIPLIDVFCQYGLGYLLFTLAFLVLPNTYTVCAAIVSIMNIAGFVLYLLILRTLIKNPYQFSLIGVGSVFGIYVSNANSMNLLPSTFGFRYLPTLLWVYFLVKGNEWNRDKLKKKSTIGLWLFNAFWSLECLAYYVCITAFYVWLMKHSFKSVFWAMSKLLLTLLLAFLVLFGLYFLFFRQFPHVETYIKHPLSYLTGRHDGGSFTQQIGPFTGRYLFFFPMAIVSIICFYYSVFSSRKSVVSAHLNKLYLVNFSGIVFFIYIAVHSFVFHIKIEWPLFLPGFIGAIFFVKTNSRNMIFRFLSTALVWLTCVVFFCVFLTRTIYVMPSNSGVNDSLIYHLVHFKKEVFENFWYNVSHFCNKMNYKKEDSDRQFIQAFQYACRKYDSRQEMSELIEKYYKNRQDAMIFSVSSVEILFEHNKYHSIFVNPMNDVSVDATQKDIIMQKLNDIKFGDIVIVEKDIGLDLFQTDVLRLLWKKFGFDKIEETPNVWVFKLTNEKAGGVPWFLGQRHSLSYLGRNGVVDYRQPLNMKNLDRRSYAYYDHAVTIELDFNAAFFVTGIRFWHLSGSKDVLKHRFFSNNEIKNFNVLVSTDRKKWDMVVSEANYFMNDKKYYYKDITPIKTKYLRLNFLVDNSSVVIPDLEVFGENKSKGILHTGH
jgi:hypothetical protein